MNKLIASAISLWSIFTAAPMTPATRHADGSAFAFAFTGIDGKPLPLANYQGKALLVVNTASFCGFTKQYAGLQKLWSDYEQKGLVVIGVPSNDFGGQEPKAEGDIKSFCEGAFGVTFPLTTKQVVTGDAAHPFYKWAATAAGPDGVPGWNFHKYLIGRDGRLIAAFSSRTSPDSDTVKDAIEKALAEPAAATGGKS